MKEQKEKIESPKKEQKPKRKSVSKTSTLLKKTKKAKESKSESISKKKSITKEHKDIASKKEPKLSSRTTVCKKKKKDSVKKESVPNEHEQQDKKRKKKKKKLSLWVVFLCFILDLGAIGCLVLAYGPNEEFKNFLITTAMSTMNHKYLARMIYDEDTIQQVLKENTIIEVNEETNTDEIVIGNYETHNYESEYEEQILKKDEGNNLYKIIHFQEDGCTFYIAVIYEPSRIHLVNSQYLGRRGETIREIAKKNDAILAMNASGFEDPGGMGNGARPTGVVIKDGKIVWKGKNTHWISGLIGFNKEHKLVLTKENATTAIKNGMVDAISFGPFLIVNGKPIQGKSSQKHPRSVIAQRKDGIVLFVIIDGNGNKYGYRGGATYTKVVEVLQRYNVYTAANLDGGASSILIENNKIVNHPVAYSSTGERDHPNAWIVK